MNQPTSSGNSTSFDALPLDDLPAPTPDSVRVIRILGAGRAARAQLVEATFADGRTVKCVEKVFAPGLLTRTIYRLSFQSSFAYQKNRHAILASYYRRRVAGAILAASDIKCPDTRHIQSAKFPRDNRQPEVAQPLYVRFDQPTGSWVLAAQWVDGRGIKPAPADPSRLSRRLRLVSTRGQAVSTRQPHEIDELVEVMRQIESLLSRCGLVGSGWQVSPRAIVSTANLLRVDNGYSVIDLESGIPAVLVPRYLLSGLLRGELPPFDDLDATQLKLWLDENARVLNFRIGPAAVEQLYEDTASLIESSAAWKQSEVALFRRPWRWLSRHQWSRYCAECFRRWDQDEVVDSETSQRLRAGGWSSLVQASLIWCLGLLPSSLGRFTSRLAGQRSARQNALRWIHDASFRQREFAAYQVRTRQRWIAAGRLATHKTPGILGSVIHRAMELVLPASVHRLMTDTSQWRDLVTACLLLLLSRRYQSWLGQQRIESAITNWQDSERISGQQAAKLRNDLCGEEVRVYTRGFGMHLALKAIAPIVIPAKVGGIAAFFATGNPWFLIPLVFTPVIRNAITWSSAWLNRHHRIPHGEALMTSWIPTFGSAAFLIQMFASRPRLSMFLIRDAASNVGRRVPIYGGADSRTEIALIRSADWLIAAIQFTTVLTQRFRQRLGKPPVTAAAAESRETLVLPKSTRWSRWLDSKASERIDMHQSTASSERKRNPHTVAAGTQMTA